MKRVQSSHFWKHTILDNGSYKLVALFVTLILWVTILGRRDFVLARDVELEYQVPKHLRLKPTDIPQKVTVKVSGTRMALKRFSKASDVVPVDLNRAEPGPYRFVITPRILDLPVGVKVISITPEVLSLQILPADSGG